MSYLYIDHYDSFTRNLIHFLGPTQHIYTVDQVDQIKEVLSQNPKLTLVLSPGGGEPRGWVIDLVQRELHQRMVVGVCLGMQTLCMALGGRLVPCQNPFHGRAHVINPVHCKPYLANKRFTAASYNSLVVCFDDPPLELEIDAFNEDGEIQAVSGGWQSQGAPFFGVQYHPESFLSRDCAVFADAVRTATSIKTS